MNSIIIEPAYRLAVKSIATVTVASHIACLHWQKQLPGPQDSITEWIASGSSILGVVLGVLLAFHLVFRKWLWRWKALRGHLVRFPDLSGTWLARWESISFDSVHYSVVTIRHDFDRIVVTSLRRTEKGEIISDGISLSCQLQMDEQTARTVLFVVYRNRPGDHDNMAEGGRRHEGCARLELIDADRGPAHWKLVGDYWTNKPWSSNKQVGDGGTRGTLSMAREASLAAFDEDESGLRMSLLGRTVGEEPRLSDASPEVSMTAGREIARNDLRT